MKKICYIAFICIGGLINTLKAQTPVTNYIYEYWNSTIHRHFYTTDFNELGNGSQGYYLQQTIGYLKTAGGGDPVYRFYNSSTAAHYYTENSSVYPLGFHLESIMGYAPTIVEIRHPIYEFYNSGDYYYSPNSTAPAGYHSDGIAYYSF